MVKKVENNFQCETCAMLYKDMATAQKCEDWCNKTGSCNLDIVKEAVNE